MFWSTIAALATLGAPAQLGSFEVVDVERHSAWAGKLGQRVTETLTVKGEHGTFRVSLVRYHTRIVGTAPAYSKGDLLSISGVMVGHRILGDVQVEVL